MKKQGILYLAAFVAFMLMVSCSNDKKNEAKDAALNNMNDSVNYALGIGNGYFIKSYYLNELANEDVAISAFIDALDKGYGNPKENDEMHNLGIRIGSSFKEQEKGGFMGNPDIKFDYDLVKKGLLDGLKATGESTMMEEADLYIRNVMGEIQENQMENPEGKIFLSKERVDSLNYSLGLANGFSLKTFYLENEQPTQEMMNSLIAGIDEVANNKSEFFDLETLGENLGSALKAQEETGLMDIEGITVNLPIIKQALINGMKGYENQMNERQAEYYMRTVIQMQEEKKFQEVYGDNKRAGEEFLAENAKNSDVVVLPSGLQYKIIKQGNGEKPNATSVVNVHYHGTLIDGTVFDSSVERGKPTSFGVNQVISGWTEALQLMPVGSKWMLYIPQNLAYGAADRGTIKPYSALIFEVELLGIEQ